MKNASIGAQIRAARTAKGMTTTQLGAQVGVVQRTVERWESGFTRPDARYRILIEDELDLGRNTLVDDEDEVEVAA